jgi:AcrR family transcriptional regulator
MPAAPPSQPRIGGRGARERILQAARVLFRERGINATGVAELAAAGQVSKRTLYQHFPSKRDVVLASLREYERDLSLGPEGVLSREDLSPRARLLELFAAAGEDRHPLRGCPFATAAVEFADPGDPVHRQAAAHKRALTEQLTELALQAGARQADQVGRRLALLYDGAAAQAVVYDSREPAAEAYAIAASILREAID